MDFNRMLAGKRCVVSSGAHGMGYSIARLFAKQGARVAICGRDPSGAESGEKLARISPGSFFFRCDLANKEATEDFADAVTVRFGGADVLVCNAGINRKELVTELCEENLDYVEAVNLRSALRLTKAFLPGMEERRSGNVLFISSMNALAPSPRTGSYVMSKGALGCLMKVTAVEEGPFGIRCNAIAPGWVATTYLRSDVAAAGGGIRGAEKVFGALTESAPLLSPARAEDIANTALYLASDMSRFVTGVILTADGGATVQAGPMAFPCPENFTELQREYFESILAETESI